MPEDDSPSQQQIQQGHHHEATSNDSKTDVWIIEDLSQPQPRSNSRGFASQATETHPDSLTKDAKGDWVRRQK